MYEAVRQGRLKQTSFPVLRIRDLSGNKTRRVNYVSAACNNDPLLPGAASARI